MTDIPGTNGRTVARWTPIGITFAADLTFEEWFEQYNQASATHKSINWFLGDALLRGEDFEQFSQAVDEKYREQHKDRLWVARAIPPSRRRDPDILSWSVHREVATLDAEDQERWLAMAEEGRWTVTRIKEELKAAGQPRRSDNFAGPNYRRNDPSPAPDQQPRPNGEDEPLNKLVARPVATLRNTPGFDPTALRALIKDVRACGADGGILPPLEEVKALEGRIAEAFGEIGKDPGPIFSMDKATLLRPFGWWWTLIEKEMQGGGIVWEARLRKEGQKLAIGLNQHPPSAVIEAALAALLSDMSEGE